MLSLINNPLHLVIVCVYRSPGSSTVYLKLTYLDEDLRLVRNLDDGKLFIFTKEIF